MAKYTIDKIRNIVESNNYVLLSTEYLGCYEKLKMRCPKGHDFEIMWYKFQDGHGCSVCNGGMKHSYNHIKREIELEEYKLLSTNYKSNKQKLTLRCNNGHVYNTTYNDFKSGHRCRECYDGNRRYTIDEVREFYKKEGYVLLSTTYKNVNSELDIKCDKGHFYKSTLHHFIQYNRCPICSQNLHQSKGEKEVVDFISQIYDGKIIENDRTTIRNPLTGYMLELDIYLPDMKKAIEYNGAYWHRNGKDKIKLDGCIENGINLITINHSDWKHTEKRDICKETLKRFVYEM